MMKLIAIAAFAICVLLVRDGETAPAAIQVLPERVGYVPVYIRNGDTPLSEINPALAEAFHESNHIQTRQIKGDESGKPAADRQPAAGSGAGAAEPQPAADSGKVQEKKPEEKSQEAPKNKREAPALAPAQTSTTEAAKPQQATASGPAKSDAHEPPKSEESKPKADEIPAGAVANTRSKRLATDEEPPKEVKADKPAKDDKASDAAKEHAGHLAASTTTTTTP